MATAKLNYAAQRRSCAIVPHFPRNQPAGWGQITGISSMVYPISLITFHPEASILPNWYRIDGPSLSLCLSVSLSLSFCFILNAMVVTRVGITYGHGADTECKWYSFVSAQNRKQIKPTIHLRTQVVCLTEWWINTHRLFLSLNSKASDCYTIQFDSVVYRTAINSGACFHSLIIIFVFVFVFFWFVVDVGIQPCTTVTEIQVAAFN